MGFNSKTAKVGGKTSKRGLSKSNQELRDIFQGVIEANEKNIGIWLNESAKESPTKAKIVEIFKQYNADMEKAGRPYRYS